MKLNNREQLKKWVEDKNNNIYNSNINIDEILHIYDTLVLWYSPVGLKYEEEQKVDLFSIISNLLKIETDSERELSFFKCEGLDIKYNHTGNKLFDFKQKLLIKNNIFNILLRDEIIKNACYEIIDRQILPEEGVKCANRLICDCKLNLLYYYGEFIEYEKYKKIVK